MPSYHMMHDYDWSTLFLDNLLHSTIYILVGGTIFLPIQAKGPNPLTSCNVSKVSTACSSSTTTSTFARLGGFP